MAKSALKMRDLWVKQGETCKTSGRETCAGNIACERLGLDWDCFQTTLENSKCNDKRNVGEMLNLKWLTCVAACSSIGFKQRGGELEQRNPANLNSVFNAVTISVCVCARRRVCVCGYILHHAKMAACLWEPAEHTLISMFHASVCCGNKFTGIVWSHFFP